MTHRDDPTPASAAAGSPPGRDATRLRSGDTHIAVEQLRAVADPPVHVLFCGGFHSSMQGLKALAIEAFCATHGHACTRFDYRGHGASGGDVERLTLSDWLDDALQVLDHVTGDTPTIVVGSSMGAWLAVHVALRRPRQIAALVLVAAAPDFLERLQDRLRDPLQDPLQGAPGDVSDPSSIRERLARGEVVRWPTPEDPAGYPITRALLDSGRALALLTPAVTHALDCPIRMLHGTADDVAPWQRAVTLLERLESPDATLELVRGGDHRLSHPAELARLRRLLDELATPFGTDAAQP